MLAYTPIRHLRLPLSSERRSERTTSDGGNPVAPQALPRGLQPVFPEAQAAMPALDIHGWDHTPAATLRKAVAAQRTTRLPVWEHLARAIARGVRSAGMILAPPAVLPSRPCAPRSGASRCGSSSRRLLSLAPPFLRTGVWWGWGHGGSGTACRNPGPGFRLMHTEYQGRAEWDA